MSYVATTIRRGGTGDDNSEVDPSEFSKTDMPYKTENYPDILDYAGRDAHNALDRQSVRELKLMPCVAISMPLKTAEEVDPPEISIHGRRIVLGTSSSEEELSESEEEEDPQHRRSQSTRKSSLLMKFHSRSHSLPADYEEQSRGSLSPRSRSRSPRSKSPRSKLTRSGTKSRSRSPGPRR